jgi:hypothetical protein
MLLLPKGQTGETWEPSRKHCFFGNRGAWVKKVLLLGHLMVFLGPKVNAEMVSKIPSSYSMLLM